MRPITHILIFSTSLAQAQVPLPLYEAHGPFSFYLERDRPVSEGIWSQYDTITVIDDSGLHLGLLDSLWSEQVAECCTDPDPMDVVGRFRLDQPIDTSRAVYVAGVVNEGAMARMTEDRTKATIDLQCNAGWQSPPMNERVQYGWMADPWVPARRWLIERQVDAYGGPPYDRSCFSLLDSCIATGIDSITELRCRTPWPFMYGGEPDMLLFFVNGSLLNVARDVRFCGWDGYGPFTYAPQYLMARYRYEGRLVHVFRPGYTLVHENGTWHWMARDAVLYYGECDCPEEDQ